MLGPMSDINQHLDWAREIKAQQKVNGKLLDFQAEWGTIISRITEQKYGLVYIPIGWGAELRVLSLESDYPFVIETFKHEPLIGEIFTAIYGECGCCLPEQVCRTCESVAEAIYGKEVTKYTVVGYEFPADEETVKKVVAKYA